MEACKLSGARRLVMGALIILCDSWNGRVCRAYHEIARIAGVSPRRCADILAEFIDKGYVNLLETGRGRKPTMLQVVPADQIVAQNTERHCTATKTRSCAIHVRSQQSKNVTYPSMLNHRASLARAFQ